MDDQYPKPVSDPASDGLPEYADDDSQAWDEVDSPRIADGRDPAPLPPDREDGPVAMDEYGTTPEEQRRGEPMDLRLSREEPEVTADPAAEPAPEPDDLPPLDEPPVEPRTDSQVSMYDRPDDYRVGRLVAPDEGAHGDEESDEIAYDAGAAGGGASAEELAMHPVPEE
jgi:hypothetical protein